MIVHGIWCTLACMSCDQRLQMSCWCDCVCVARARHANAPRSRARERSDQLPTFRWVAAALLTPEKVKNAVSIARRVPAARAAFRALFEFFAGNLTIQSGTDSEASRVGECSEILNSVLREDSTPQDAGESKV